MDKEISGDFVTEKTSDHDGDGIFHRICAVREDAGEELFSEEYLSVQLVTDGEGFHCFEDQTVPCKAGDMYVVSPGVPHGYRPTNKDKPLIVRVLSFRLKEWLRGDVATVGNKRYCYGAFQNEQTVAYAMLNSRMKDRVYSILNSVEYELQNKYDEWKSIVKAHITQLLCYFGRYVNSSIRIADQKAREQEAVLETVDIIKREFCDCDLSLEEIAKRVFISPSYLSRIFKLYTGKLFSECLREQRLKHASALLEETELLVDDIVERCGLRNVPAFYRNFKDSFGMTPQKYRQIAKKSKDKFTETQSSRGDKIMIVLKEISENLQKGKAKIVKEMVQAAIDEGADPEKILNEGLLDGMSVIGERFKNNEIYVPEVLIAARAMNMGAQILKPYLASSGVTARGKVCIGTVQGDLHDIGKNLVKMMMEGKGLEVVDLGTDVPPERFIQAVTEEGCQVICCSALLTTTMGVMADVVKALTEAGLRDKVKVMIGGAPITQEFCDKIGADCYTPDAASAADAAVELCRA